MIEIKNRFTGALIYKSETAETIRAAVVEAISARANLAGANLAGANLADANLAGANLADANLAGANLAGANLAGANLADAYLADAYLADANLAGAYLADAYLADAYLAGANLAGANLADANLAGAYLADAYLARARSLPAGFEAKDPPEPYIYRGGVTSPEGRVERMRLFRERNPDVPVVENLDRKILDAITTGGGELNMGAWHTCETTHCRAGWAIHLAGPAGYALQEKLGGEDRGGAERAGRAIYRASTGRVPHFFADNESALEDIKRCAEEQATENAL
jgi:hypothetical protein